MLLTKKDTTREVWESLQFVVKARAKANANKRAISGLQVEKDHLVCTDGHRLHVANIKHKIEPGLYDLPKVTKAQVALEPMPGNFPKWRDIVPATGRKFKFSQGPRYDELAEREDSLSALVYALASQGLSCKPRFLMDTGPARCTVSYSLPHRPIRIDLDGGLTAVIMPTMRDEIIHILPTDEEIIAATPKTSEVA